jgi:hypothetical protein
VVLIFDDVILVLNKLDVVVFVSDVLVVTIKLFDDIDWNDPYDELVCTDDILVERIVGAVILDVIFKFDNIAEDPVRFVRMMLLVVMFDVLICDDMRLVVVILVFCECIVLMVFDKFNELADIFVDMILLLVRLVVIMFVEVIFVVCALVKTSVDAVIFVRLEFVAVTLV